MRKKHPDFRNNHDNPLYRVWNAIKQRCHNPESTSYKYYGAKGITVCDKWYNSFNEFVIDMGPKPTLEHELDRIKSGKGYEPDNCRWSTSSENKKNTSNAKKQKYHLVSAEELSGYLALRQEGKTIAHISNVYNRSAITVSKHLAKEEGAIDLRRSGVKASFKK